MWFLNKIPRVLHVYFGGDKISYLRYMTVKTFIGLNKDWSVVFYYPKYPQEHKSWVSYEQKYNFEGRDFFNDLLKLPLSSVAFDFSSIGINDEISEVYKSDFLRWYLLSTVGGLWSDMDILYFRPMNSLAFNAPENSHVDTGVCICKYGHSIGFMLASKNNLYYKYIWQRTKAAWNSVNYQSIGSVLSNHLFPSITSIQRVLPQLNPVNIPMEAVYAYDALHIYDIYKSEDMGKYTRNSIGLHWYAGHPLAGDFLRDTDGGIYNIPNNVLGRTLTALTKTSLPNFIDNLVGKDGGTVLDLGCGNKMLSRSISAKVKTVDIWDRFKPDLVWDLNNIPLPFESDSFDVVILVDVIEHLKKEKGLAVLEEAKRIANKAVFVLTPLWWTENIEEMMDESSSYYQNPYERHQSLWKKEDFNGWKEITELSFIGNYYVGVFEKVRVTVEVQSA